MKLEPKLITCLREGYSARQALSDLSAGVIVGVVALPLAIAFAIASGVKPEQGLYTAIVAGFLISALGGSRVQIGGPTGAFIVIIYRIVQERGAEGLVAATVVAGALLVLMGLMRLGSVIKFVPYPVTVGFTAGIALIIAVSQVPDFFGLRLGLAPVDLVEKMRLYLAHWRTWSPWAAGIGLVTILITQLWPRFTHKVPGALIAILLTSALVAAFDLPVETIGDRFGRVPTALPRPSVPMIEWATLQQAFSPALSIALLAAIESLLSATVADGMIGARHRSNMELIAQGVANIVSPIFGGVPATGAIARTATNVKNGGRTPVAGIVHAGVLLLIMTFFARWAELIPLCTLAGVLLVVAWNMGEVHLFARLFRSPRGDVLVLLVTFALTVLVDLTVALQAGMVLAAFLFMHQMASLTGAGYFRRMMSEEETPDDPNTLARRQVPAGVEIFEVYGTLFFGAASKFKDALHTVERAPRVLILRLRDVLVVDATGLRALEDVIDKTRKDGATLILSGVHAQPLAALARSGLVERIGEDNITAHIDDALDRARSILGLPAVPHPEPFVPTVSRDTRGGAPSPPERPAEGA